MNDYDPTKAIQEIALDLKATRKDCARVYALVVQNHWSTVDWTRANAAIMKRWSKSGLRWIKVEAWKLVERWVVARREYTE